MSIKLNSNCKSISPNKFNRLLNRSDVEKGMVYYTLPNTWECKVAQPAILLDGFVYFKIPTKKQTENRLKMVVMRVDKKNYESDKYLTCFLALPQMYPDF